MKGVYLLVTQQGKDASLRRGGAELLPAGTTTPCAQALGHLVPSQFLIPRASRSPPSHSFSCPAHAGHQQSADWCCPQQPATPGSSGTAVILLLQPPAQAAWGLAGCWWDRQTVAPPYFTGLAPKPVLGWRASDMLVHRVMLCQTKSHHCCTALPRWHGLGLPAAFWAMGQGSPRGWGFPEHEILQVCSHLAECQLWAWMVEPEARQVWLCQAGRRSASALRGLPFPWFCLGLYVCYGQRKKISTSNPI